MIAIDKKSLISRLIALREWSDAEAQAPLYAHEDYFWSIPVDERYDAATIPAELTIGQLVDSSSFLVDALAGKPVISYHAVWAADVLHGIAAGVVAPEEGRPPLALGLRFADLVDVGRRVVEKTTQDRILVSVNAYWRIDPGQRYQVLRDPTRFSRQHVARLADFVRTEPEKATDRMRNLDAIADVLELVGHRLFMRDRAVASAGI